MPTYRCPSSVEYQKNIVKNQTRVVAIYKNGDPKSPEEISRALGEYVHANSQLPPSR